MDCPLRYPVGGVCSAVEPVPASAPAQPQAPSSQAPLSHCHSTGSTQQVTDKDESHTQFV